MKNKKNFLTTIFIVIYVFKIVLIIIYRVPYKAINKEN